VCDERPTNRTLRLRRRVPRVEPWQTVVALYSGRVVHLAREGDTVTACGLPVAGRRLMHADVADIVCPGCAAVAVKEAA
jgi:hypothetical protein